jgi:hypothetical protein
MDGNHRKLQVGDNKALAHRLSNRIVLANQFFSEPTEISIGFLAGVILASKMAMGTVETQ